jgi:hypothetical protein
MDLNFEDPPERFRKRKSYEWTAIYQALKANPAQWALLAEGGLHSTYTAVSQGKISTFHPAMGIEMRTANNSTAKPRTCDLYARYNPDLDTALTVKERAKVWVQARKIAKEKEQMKVSSTVETKDD